MKKPTRRQPLASRIAELSTKSLELARGGDGEPGYTAKPSNDNDETRLQDQTVP